jgi:hypothetical protein
MWALKAHNVPPPHIETTYTMYFYSFLPGIRVKMSPEKIEDSPLLFWSPFPIDTTTPT